MVVPLRESPLAPLAILALAKLGLHLATSGGYGLFRDELYYLVSSDHLAWGYVEHPPLSIALLWLSRQVLGDSLIAIRSLPAVAGAATVFVAGLLARELGGGRRAQLLAALAVLVMPSYLAMDHVFSMNAFDILFWAMLGWIAARILARDERCLWLVFGAVAGLGLMNKVSVGFLAFGLAVGLGLTQQRRQLASPWLWLGGLIALLLFLPHLVWQAQHDWATFEFQANARAEKNLPLSPLEFAGQQVLMANPVMLPLWLAGLGGLLLSSRLAPFRPLGIAYPVLFVFLVSQTAKAYYLTPIYSILLAAGAVMLEPALERRSGLAPTLTAILVLAGVATLPLAIPVLPPESLVAYTRTIGIEVPTLERHEQGALPQSFADMHGWQELVDTVARVVDSLPPEERQRAVVLATNYGEAGAIDFLGRARGLPPAVSGHNSYWLWRPSDLDGPVIALRRSREELERWFERVERVDTVHCRWCMPYQNDAPIHLARGLKVPLHQLWQEIKRFM